MIGGGCLCTKEDKSIRKIIPPSIKLKDGLFFKIALF
jgi:hypothetical protein